MTYQQLAVGPAQQEVAQLQRDDLRQMLVLGDRADLFFRELTQPKSVLERQHGRPPKILHEGEIAMRQPH
jgi:hypothetical protein